MRAVTYLLITTILGVSSSSAHAQNLVFSTYLGGSAGYNGSNPLTYAQNSACDALGNIYVTGATQVSNLPVLNAYQPTPAPNSTMTAFVAKYNPAGQPLWCTYLGGNKQSMGLGVAATPNGGVAVTGITTSNGSGSFPTTSNAYQSQNQGQSDYFVSVFNANGNLQYSTYLGGSGVEGGVGQGPNGQIIFTDNSNNGNGVAVDANGRVYVGGMSNSGGSGGSKFPTTPNALQSNLAGAMNATLSILDPSQSGAAALVYSSFLGGDKDNQGHSVAVNASGSLIAVGGFTTSSSFPTTTNAYRSTAPPGGFSPNCSNGFITQFQSSQPGSPSSQYTMLYSTYLGGNSSTARDDVYGMTMTSSGLIVATGRTQSAIFPMTAGGPTIFNSATYLLEGKSGDMPYAVKINPSLNGTASLVYSTFLGGSSATGQWGSFCTSVAVDAQCAVYVAGETSAQGAPYVQSDLTAPQTFPYTSSAYLQALQGQYDALLMQIDPSGANLDYSTYLGGTLSDRTYGLAVDPDGNVILTGLTFSSNFPLQNPAQTWPGNTNYQNAFVTEFSPLYSPSTIHNLIIDNGATYPVSGDITYDNEYIGQNSTGTLIQGGFTNTVNNNLRLGQNAGASGTYNLSDGSLSVGGHEYIGYFGSGTFTQTGGTHTVSGDLFLAANTGSSGTYSLSGGSLSVGGYEAVGYFGTGSFTQSGGSHMVTGLYLGTAAGATGTYDLSDGSLSVIGNGYIGSFGSGSFTQSGGTNTVNDTLTLAASDGSSGTYNLQGGGLTAGNIIVNAGGSFNQTGGSLSAPITLSGGTLAAGTDNGLGNQTLTINRGTLQAAAGTTPTLGNAISVGGDFTLGGANNLTLSGAVDLGGATRSLSVSNSGDTTFSGIVSNGGLSINNTGGGKLNLSGANTYNGGTTLTAGTLLIGNNSGLGLSGLTISGGAIGASAANITVDNPLAIGSSFNLGGTSDTNLILTSAINLGGNTLTHNGASTDTVSGNLTSTTTGGITVTAGTLNLTGNNAAYAGTSTVTGGTLNLEGAGNYTGNNTVSGGILNLNSASAITYSGANTVTGGSLNLSSALATYSGASTVMGGTLNLSAGNYTGGLTLGANGIFNFSGGTFVPAGGANINTAAGSTLTIAPGLNLNIGAGNTLTSSGTTIVNGTLTGNLTNNTGGLVNGSGVITGALTNNGTVNPGNSPGTLTVGTYTSNPGSTQTVEIASASSHDKIITTAVGGATLNGGTVSPRLLGGFFPSTNQLFNIIQTTGGGAVKGVFAGIDNTRVGNSRTLFWQLNYGHSVDLQAVGNYTPPGMALSRNQLSVGNALNSLAPSTTGGDLLTVLDAINALTTDSSVAAAYNEISPAKYAALPTLTMTVTHLQFQYLQNRLARERWEAELGSDVVRAGGGGFVRGFNFNYDNNEKMWLAATNMTLSDAGRPLIDKSMEQRWGIYLEPMANWGTQSSTANLPGYRYKNFGFTLGAEYWLKDNLLVGVNSGYSRTLTGIGGTGGGLNANIIPFNAYAAFFWQGFYANGTAGYTYSGYDLERNIVFGTINRTAQAHTAGNQFQTAAEAGYDTQIGNAVVGPVLSWQYATQTTGGFTESNAGALNLKVDSQTADSLQSGVGARASYKVRVGTVTARPQLSVTWQHEFSDNPRGLKASLAAGGSTMNFRTGRVGQDFALISADLPAQVTKNLVAYVGYTAEVGRDKSTNQGVNLGLKVKF